MKNEKSFSVARPQRMAMQGPTSSAQAAGGLHASVVQQIGMRIVQGEFVPGEVLPTADDSSVMLGVSRRVAARYRADVGFAGRRARYAGADR
jgi:hypothetical protein